MDVYCFSFEAFRNSFSFFFGKNDTLQLSLTLLFFCCELRVAGYELRVAGLRVAR